MFGPYGIEMSRSEKLYFAISILLLILSAIIFIAKRMSKDKLFRVLARKWFNVVFWVGLIALVWSGFRYETIQYLSANVIVLLDFIVGVVWAACIVKYQLTTYRQLRVDFEKEQVKLKYM